jgi:hypothetical protein
VKAAHQERSRLLLGHDAPHAADGSPCICSFAFAVLHFAICILPERLTTGFRMQNAKGKMQNAKCYANKRDSKRLRLLRGQAAPA